MEFMAAGVKRTIKKKETKHEKMRGNMDTLSGVMTRVRGYRNQMDLTKEFDTHITTVLKEIKQGKRVCHKLFIGLEPSEKSALQKTLQSNNLEQRFDLAASLMFKKEYEEMAKIQTSLEDMVRAAETTVRVAMMSEYGDENGNVSWVKMSETLSSSSSGLEDVFQNLNL
jgi:hypothetical protein